MYSVQSTLYCRDENSQILVMWNMSFFMWIDFYSHLYLIICAVILDFINYFY